MPTVLRLHYNENTGGCSPAVLAALRAMTSEEISTYPDYASITARAERWLGVGDGCVQLTNGLDEGLQVVTQYAVWHPIDTGHADTKRAGETRPATLPEVIVVEPAFETYALCAEAVCAKVVRIQSERDFRFPLEDVLDAISPSTRLVNLADPNNPTGRLIPAGAVERVAARAPHAVVLVDEAYADFSGQTSIGPVLSRHGNVIIGRTFAKAHGLAALRIGALVARRDTLDRLRPRLLPFSVNACAAKALSAALDDRDYMPSYVAETARARDLIYAFCDRQGIESWPSAGNFVLFRIGPRASDIVAALAARGIAVRDKSAAPGCAGCIRMTAGLVVHTEVALAALEDILASRAH
jgi:histidinol-phosphate aminotransferase